MGIRGITYLLGLAASARVLVYDLVRVELLADDGVIRHGQRVHQYVVRHVWVLEGAWRVHVPRLRLSKRTCAGPVK